MRADQRERGQHAHGRPSAGPPGRSCGCRRGTGARPCPGPAASCARRLVLLCQVVVHLLGDPVLRPDDDRDRAARSGRRPRRDNTWATMKKPAVPNVDRVRGQIPPDGGGTTPHAHRCRTAAWKRGAAGLGRGRLERAGRRRRASGCRSAVRRPGGKSAAARCRKTTRFPRRAWTSPAAQPLQHVRRQAEDLGQLEHQEGPLLDARGGRLAEPVAQLGHAVRARAGEAQRSSGRM